MLVSSIARFSAINNMNNASFGMMAASDAMVRNACCPSKGGEHDLAMLKDNENKLNMDLISNKLLYKISYLQEKLAKKHQDADIKRSFDTFA